MTAKQKSDLTVAQLKAELVSLISTTNVTPAEGEVPGPIDAAGAIDVTTPNGVHFQLAVSFETGAAAEPDDEEQA